eukprot:209992-Rhodomonas_salina.1
MSASAPAVRCAVLTWRASSQVGHQASEAVSQARMAAEPQLAQVPTTLRPCYNMPVTDVLYGTTMAGTDIVYGATMPVLRGYGTTMAGTDVGYVLRWL